MPDYLHWFPTHKSLTASQFNERAALLARTLERMGIDRPHQARTDTQPDRQLQAAIRAVFDRHAQARRIEARGGLVAALAANDRAFAGRLNRAADVALLARLDQGIAAARDPRRPTYSIHRMP